MKSKVMALAVFALFTTGAVFAADEPFSPYGTAKEDMHGFTRINTVFDVNYTDPAQLNLLYNYIKNTAKNLNGKVVVVTHGPEVRVFAKENYMKYQGVVDKMAELSKDGVEFRMCNNAMHSAGFVTADMHGFVTVVPAGYPELAYLQEQGYRFINPLPLPTKDVRYLDHPELKK
jgi:hypothetical protein